MTEPAGFKFSPDFAEALAYAAHLHTGHRRKQSQVPYISHLLAVSALVIENGGAEDEAIAALLHDSIEDQAFRLGGAQELRERLRRKFGASVVEIIDGCTDAEDHPKPDWDVRKRQFIESIASASESVCIVIAADKLHNAQCILRDVRTKGGEAWGIFSKPRESSLWYYRTAANALKARLTGRGRYLAEELDRVVTELEKEPLQ